MQLQVSPILGDTVQRWHLSMKSFTSFLTLLSAVRITFRITLSILAENHGQILHRKPPLISGTAGTAGSQLGTLVSTKQLMLPCKSTMSECGLFKSKSNCG